MKFDLDSRLKSALEQRRGEWPDIANGSNVSYSWLSKFVNGHIPNPGYTTLKGLHEYLSKQKKKP